MIERFLQTIKDPQRLSLLVAVLFFVGILFSFYFLFTLPHDLVFKGGMTTSGLATVVYTKLFIVVGITFLLGVAAINFSNKVKKEIIVFKEKVSDLGVEQATKDEQIFTIDLQTFKNSINNEKGAKALQLGLNSICKLLQAGQGAFYIIQNSGGKKVAELKSSFALQLGENGSLQFELGEGLVGQVAASGKSVYLDELPEGYTNFITSGLGMAAPKFLYIAAIKKDNEVKAVIEVATFTHLNEAARKQSEELATLLLEKI